MVPNLSSSLYEHSTSGQVVCGYSPTPFTFFHLCDLLPFKVPNSLLSSAYLSCTYPAQNSAHLSYPLNFPCPFKTEIPEWCYPNQAATQSTHFRKHFLCICASQLLISVCFSDCFLTYGTGYVVCTQWALCVNTHLSLNTHALYCFVQLAIQGKLRWLQRLWWPNK